MIKTNIKFICSFATRMQIIGYQQLKVKKTGANLFYFNFLA